MRRIQSHLLGIDHGSQILFSDFQSDGNMWTGTGAREHKQTVEFSEGFESPPVVQVTVSMWDFDNATNQRGDISAVDITETGFTLLFKTWGDTRIARIRADWTATGPLPHEDDWDLY
jgi:hypothetical protein